MSDRWNAARAGASTLAATLLLGLACAKDRPAAAASPPVSFNDLFGQVSMLTLASPAADPVGFAADALITNRDVVLVDSHGADIKIFSRANGSLVRTLGRPGDGQGEFRRPVAIASLDSGRYVIFDQGRRILSFRDSTGAVIDETPALKGFFNGLIALPDRRHVLLAGATFNQTGDAKGVDLHEFDYDGKRVASYAKAPPVSSEWAARLNATFVTRVGSDIVTGSLNSNRLRIYDPATGAAKWIDVAPAWYQPLEYPSDRLLRRNASAQTVAQRVTTYMHAQRLMNGALPLAGGRLLVRFMAFTSPVDRAYYYAVTDTAGTTYAVSRATRSYVVATKGDTVFWMAGGGAAPARLGSGVLNASRWATMASK